MSSVMDFDLVSDIAVQFSAETRLYSIQGDGAAPGLMLERWEGREGLSVLFEYRLTALSTDSFLGLDDFLGRSISFVTTLSDGTRRSRTGLVSDAEQIGSDGGLARYRLTVVPWLWILDKNQHSRTFQDKTVIQIVEQIFADYSAYAAWTVTDEVSGFIEATRPRSYCAQYRESDFAFVTRLFAEEGLGFTFVDDSNAPAGHSLKIFADSTSLPQDACSESSMGGQGIRFHRAASQEEQDAIQVFGAMRRLPYSTWTATSYDFKAKSVVASSVPTSQKIGGLNAPSLESYDHDGAYAYGSIGEAQRYGDLRMQAREARNKEWIGAGSVRTFSPGTWFGITQSTLDAIAALTQDNDPAKQQFVLTEVIHAGVNNLPRALQRRLNASLGEHPAVNDLDDDKINESAVDLMVRAESRGYANSFTALRRDIPWRPVLQDGTGLRLNPKPSAPGSQSAIVIGPNGETTPSGSNELYTDALGRIKVRFHWQQGQSADDQGSAWIRVASPSAGGGSGHQHIPRIGQEVLVQFLESDIDRPIVIGALYNGQGEAGVSPSPGGSEADPTDASLYAQAMDRSASAQGNLAGGNSPAWHGASADAQGHRNAAGLSGHKSKEFGGAGYNQLVMDDHDDQLRTQLATTQAATQLTLGHLIHQADNHRGSFRGQGFELRTDAYGAIRGQAGLLLSTYGGSDPIQSAQPAGDHSPGQALLKQANALAQAHSQIATTHLTVKLASVEGVTQAHQSQLDPQAAPLPALLQSASGMVTGKDIHTAQSDAAAKQTTPSDGAIPHSTDALLAITAQGGIGSVAGQDLHWSAGETLSLAQGQDLNLAIGHQTRLHTGQAIGILAGASKAGDNNTGLTLIAAKGPIDLQAQAGELKLQSKNQLKLVSVNASIDFAAAKSVTLKTAQGAAITIEGGNITVTAPGNITINAQKKSLVGAAQQDFPIAQFPHTVCLECLLKARAAGAAFAPR